MFDFLGAATAVTLSANPLAQVVAQIKFIAQSSLNNPQVAALFHEILSEQYPRLLTEQQQAITAGPGGVTTTTVPQWRLTDLSGSWACVIGPEQLALETSVYTDWSEMEGRLREALGALSEVTKIRVRERIGLRYVNHIAPDEKGEFTDRVSDQLLGLRARPDWRSALSAQIAQTVLSDGDARLVIRTGTGLGIIEPSDYFVVDIDCYDEAAARYSSEDTISYMAKFNDAAYRCFCACVTESYRTSLK